ncbi:MAG: hypothetical protein Q7R97_05575 [Candidatus Daviesbacteria bacterium]|nr:hypothetical protein [Candidatus Daviesbacteria bacterium]
MKFIAYTTKGLEFVAEKEIKAHISDAKIIEVSDKRIIFESNTGFNKLIELKTVDDLGFHENLFIIFANDSNFWTGKATEDSIYKFFRGGVELQGTITKPTGKRDHAIELRGNYMVKWEEMNEKLKYWASYIE